MTCLLLCVIVYCVCIVVLFQLDEIANVIAIGVNLFFVNAWMLAQKWKASKLELMITLCSLLQRLFFYLIVYIVLK